MSEKAKRLPRVVGLTVTPQDIQSAFELSPNPMLLIAVDPPRFTMLAANRAHAATFFTTPEALVGHGVLDVFRASRDPSAGIFLETIERSFERILATGEPDQTPVLPYLVRRRDGRTEERFWSGVNTPVFDSDGSIHRILSSARDVTAEVKERHATEARALLMREVDHRARNTLAVVQSVIRLSEGETVEDFKQVVLGRVEALGRAQSSLARRRWEGAFLEDVVAAEFAALGLPDAVRISGPAALLPPEKVQAMSMVLHELATNAAKYGALSTPSGMVSVTWETDRHDHLVLSWREDGGPPTSAPRRRGFGSRLIARLARQLGGQVHKSWSRAGLRVTLTAKL